MPSSFNSIFLGSSGTPKNYIDPDFPDVRLLMNGSGSLSGNTLLNADQSLYHISGITRTGAAAPNSGAIQLYGTNSLYGGTASNTTGSTASIVVAAGNVPAFGTGDFTLELWFYYTMGTGVDITKHIMGTDVGIRMLLTGGAAPTGFTGTTIDRLVFYSGPDLGAGVIPIGITSTAVSKNAWRYVAISRVSGTIYTYYNGNFIGSATDNTNYGSLKYAFFNGGTAGTSTRNMCGYMSNVRITVGVGRYNSVTTIPIPTEPFPYT